MLSEFLESVGRTYKLSIKFYVFLRIMLETCLGGLLTEGILESIFIMV